MLIMCKGPLLGESVITWEDGMIVNGGILLNRYTGITRAEMAERAVELLCRNGAGETKLGGFLC